MAESAVTSEGEAMRSAAQTCPDAEVLATYVSGSLGEDEADSLSEHLDACQNCQQLVDDMARRADSLVVALRKPMGDSTPPAAGVDKLIEEAKKLESRFAGAGRSSDSQAAPVPLDRFLSVLAKSRLADETEVAALMEASQLSDSLSLAQKLVEQEKLTPFQARQLLRGRWRGLVLDDYVVLEKMGQGGMGQVYKARRGDGHIVCLKVLHAEGMKSPQMLERFHREAKTLAVLDHPNIVVAHDSGECEGIPFLVMELIDGSDLGCRIRSDGPVTPDQAVEIILQSARALDYAHRRGIIHRDIKPQNLLLDNDGNVKVLDLGLARFDTVLAESAVVSDLTTITRSGFVMGTIDYIAPEQAVNSKAADYRSDVYSLGCTLYFLLTGRTMYLGETIMERLIAHRENSVPRLSKVRDGLPFGLEAVFERMVAKRPGDRYQSMAALVEDLECVQRGQPPANPIPPTASRPEAASLLPGATPPEPPAVGQTRLSTSAFDSTIDDLSQVPTLLDDTPLPMAPLAPAMNEQPGGKWSPRHLPIDKILWGGVGVVALAVLVLLSVAVKSTFATPHPDTLAGGGPGRAIVLIPFEGYNDHDYDATIGALQKHGIRHVTVSTQAGKAKSMKGKHMLVDTTIADVPARDYDTLIVCGGPKDQVKQAGDLVESSLRNGKAVAAVGGWAAIKDRWPSQYEQKPGFEVANQGGGYLLKACGCHEATKLVDYVFNDLLVAAE